jgi:hypothetical protein
MSWLSSDMHAGGLSALILGICFLSIGVVLLLVKDKAARLVPRWRKTTAIVIIAIGSTSVITGIVFCALPTARSMPSIVPTITTTTLAQDRWLFTHSDDHTKEIPSSEVKAARDNIKVEKKLLTVMLPGEEKIFQPVIDGYTFVEARYLPHDNIILALVKSYVKNELALFRYIVDVGNMTIVLRERFSMQRSEIHSTGLTLSCSSDQCHAAVTGVVLEDTSTFSWRREMITPQNTTYAASTKHKKKQNNTIT